MRLGRLGHALSRGREEVTRAFDEFLALPTGIMAGFIALAVVAYFLDSDVIEPLRPVRQGLQSLIFTTPEATAELLGVIAAGLITMSSLTFSLVLLAVQQAAGSLTFSVIEQFLRRRINQIAFGFFAGLALYALLVLSTATPTHSPVLGGTLALLLSIVSLYLLLLLLYTTINQMVPEEIARAIHDRILASRKRQLEMVRRTRRVARSGSNASASALVYADHHGFLAGIDLARLDAAARAAGETTEIVVLHAVGRFVAYGDPLAEVRGAVAADPHPLRDAIRRSLRLERQRNLNLDPAYGIEQLTNIAWTSISTSKSNPAPGLQVIRVLRDVLSRWAHDEALEAVEAVEAETADPIGRPTAVVYTDDTPERLIDALESLAVVSTESMQHQSFAEVLVAIAATFDRLSPPLQRRVEDLVRRVLTGIGDHVLTADVDSALTELAHILTAAGRTDTAAAVRAAHAAMRAPLGSARSRSNRIPQSS